MTLTRKIHRLAVTPMRRPMAYMRDVRGFDLADIKGWYRQGKWWHSGSQKGTETVRFDISRADDVYMERFCEPIPITSNGITKIRKQNFNGSYKGLWWQPPSLEINEGDTVYIAEAIIDAISLNVNGFKAVASLSTTNYPEKLFEQHPTVNWVLAYDSDSTGRNATNEKSIDYA